MTRPPSVGLDRDVSAAWGQTGRPSSASTTVFGVLLLGYGSGRYDFRRISGCKFGGGSSGGPWVTGYKAKQDVGQLRGVTSFGPTNNAFLGSPYFDKRVAALYNDAVTGQ